MKEVKIKDNIEDVIVKYVYCKDWRWMDTLSKESFQGHPFPGRVYRAVYNTKSNSYRVVLQDDELNAVLMQRLIEEDQIQGYVSNLAEISKSNILDLNITEEDLDKIQNWDEKKNMDILEPMMNPPSIQVMSLSSLIEAMRDNNAERVAKATDCLDVLYKLNTIHFELVQELIEFLIDENSVTPVGDDFLSQDKKHGLGRNIGNSLDYIKIYAGKDRTVNQNRYDLFSAMYYLFVELERRINNNLDAE